MEYKSLEKVNKFGLVKVTMTIFVTLSILSTQSAYSSDICTDVVSQQNQKISEADLFDNIQIYETRLESTYAEANTKFGQNQEINAEMNILLARLTELSRELEALQDRALSDADISKEELETAFALLDTVRLDIKSADQRVAVDLAPVNRKTPEEVWKEIEGDTSLIEAETKYEIALADGTKLSILFSENIVKEVFRSADQPLMNSSLKAITQVKKGVFGGAYAGSGIKKLKINSKLLELGAIGRHAGKLRFGGYFDNGVMHFVYWSMSGGHGSASYIVRFRDAILAAKKNRGH